MILSLRPSRCARHTPGDPPSHRVCYQQLQCCEGCCEAASKSPVSARSPRRRRARAPHSPYWAGADCIAVWPPVGPIAIPGKQGRPPREARRSREKAARLLGARRRTCLVAAPDEPRPGRARRARGRRGETRGGARSGGVVRVIGRARAGARLGDGRAPRARTRSRWSASAPASDRCPRAAPRQGASEVGRPAHSAGAASGAEFQRRAGGAARAQEVGMSSAHLMASTPTAARGSGARLSPELVGGTKALSVER